jgi:hypothetical protein
MTHVRGEDGRWVNCIERRNLKKEEKNMKKEQNNYINKSNQSVARLVKLLNIGFKFKLV